ncbi:MAG: class I SAM-dependent methyltransferase [Pseudomonadota bacterium]
MSGEVAQHYAGPGDLASRISYRLAEAGKDLKRLTPRDLAAVDEFHIRGRNATVELADKMRLTSYSRVLDIGSGLGGPARTVAQQYRCRVTGVDLTEEFCETARELSCWVRLDDLVEFIRGNALDLPFEDDAFDAAMTIHVGMNVRAKNKLYAEARRVVKRGAIFAVYDVVQGEGGAVRFPVPWARTPEISYLATPDKMKDLLRAAGFRIVEIQDSTAESQKWFEEVRARMSKPAIAPAVTFQAFLGKDFPAMARNQVINLTERRIRTVTYICQA